jgi:hypothetical protein
LRFSVRYTFGERLGHELPLVAFFLVPDKLSTAHSPVDTLSIVYKPED